MEFIKHIVFFLLISGAACGQTVHIDSNRIVFKGTVKLDDVNKEELYARAKNAILNHLKGSKEMPVANNSEKGSVVAEGSIKLAAPYHIIKTVEYILKLSVEDEKYEYLIDSVYIKEIERGGKTIRISSEKLLKGMDMSGIVSANTEKQLNEIDMDFQKLLDLIRADMKKASVVKTGNN